MTPLTRLIPCTDDTRAWGPPYAKYTSEKEGPGESAYYLSVHSPYYVLGFDPT